MIHGRPHDDKMAEDHRDMENEAWWEGAIAAALCLMIPLVIAAAVWRLLR